MALSRRRMSVLATAMIAISLPGCIRSIATSALADALSGSGGAYAKDDDPELVAVAVPFGLKTMESVLVEQPEHRGLLTALASGFVQYGVVFVSYPADQIEGENYDAAQSMRHRARKLFLRARGYGLRGLAVAHERFTDRLLEAPEKTLAECKKDDAALLYWTAAAWGLAISSDKTDTAMIADLSIVQKIADRVHALAPRWGDGAVYELMGSLESTRPGAKPAAARKYFQQALEVSEGRRAGTFVSFAESVSVKEQNVREFRGLLEKALAIDVEAHPDDKLANTIMQRRARWLLGRAEDLFLDADPAAGTGTVSLSLEIAR